MNQKKATLGRGLADLLGQARPHPPAAANGAPPPGEQLARLPVELLERGRYQPRTDLRNDTGAAGWVTDNQCSPVEQVLNVAGTNNAGDVNTDDLLNPGETWQFSCTAVISEDTLNVAGIDAQPVGPNGNPIGDPLTRAAVDLVQGEYEHYRSSVGAGQSVRAAVA